MTSQDDCRQLYIMALQQFMLTIDEIDSLTPWSERAPDWWINMRELHDDLRDRKKALTDDQ